jgi:hypothetical protein
MRLAILALSASLISAASEIPQGSHALLRLENSVSTRTAREGDFVYMRTATPIAADGRIVVPEGSYVQGVVTHSVRSGRVKGKAELSIRIDTLTLPSGKVIKLSPRLNSVDSGGTDQKVDENSIKQGSGHAADAARVAELGGTGAAVGGLATRTWTGAGIGAGAGGAVGLATVLLTRGKEVELNHGSTVDVVFDRAVPVE